MLRNLLSIFIFAMFVISCNPPVSPQAEGVIRVKHEVKFAMLPLGQLDEKKYEASGVVVAENNVYVVFDNTSLIAQVTTDLRDATVLGEKAKKVGYEGITYNPTDGTFYLVEESLKHKGEFNAKLHRADDATFPKTKKSWLDYEFQSNNKGFEGLTLVGRDNQTFLLGLCEGNQCDAGKTADIPGQGRIQVFAQQGEEWMHVVSIPLPSGVEFIDYSGMALNSDNLLAIISQESSALWVGPLNPVSWTIDGRGIVYYLPVGADGRTIYCNVEGVAWIAQEELVLVSDAKKKDQPKRCKEKTESIHLITIGQLGS